MYLTYAISAQLQRQELRQAENALPVPRHAYRIVQ
jgi:hypothetical protein